MKKDYVYLRDSRDLESIQDNFPNWIQSKIFLCASSFLHTILLDQNIASIQLPKLLSKASRQKVWDQKDVAAEQLAAHIKQLYPTIFSDFPVHIIQQTNQEFWIQYFSLKEIFTELSNATHIGKIYLLNRLKEPCIAENAYLGTHGLHEVFLEEYCKATKWKLTLVYSRNKIVNTIKSVSHKIKRVQFEIKNKSLIKKSVERLLHWKPIFEEKAIYHLQNIMIRESTKVLAVGFSTNLALCNTYKPDSSSSKKISWYGISLNKPVAGIAQRSGLKYSEKDIQIKDIIKNFDTISSLINLENIASNIIIDEFPALSFQFNSNVKDLLTAYIYQKIFHGLFKQIKFDYLVTSSATALEHLASITAKKNHIKTIVFQHGIFECLDFFPKTSDFQGTWSLMEKNRIAQSKKWKTDEILITGTNQFANACDNIKSLKENNQSAPKDIIIVTSSVDPLYSSWDSAATIKTWSAINNLSLKYPDYKWKVKSHPYADYWALYKHFILKFKNPNISIEKEKNLEESLSNAALCIIMEQTTSACLVALAAEIPVIYISTSSTPSNSFPNVLAYQEDLQPIYETDEIEAKVSAILTHSTHKDDLLNKQSKFYRKFVNPISNFNLP